MPIYQPSQVPVRLTRGHVALLEKGGLLTGRHELIEGQIYKKLEQNKQHEYGRANLMIGCFVDVFGFDFATTHIVSNTSVDVRREDNPTCLFDRSVKAALYARAQIPEYWIVDVVNRQLIVHREPAPSGFWQDIWGMASYKSVRELGKTETIAPLGMEPVIAVSKIFLE